MIQYILCNTGVYLFLFNLHVFWSESDAWKLFRGVVAIVAVFLSAYSRNPVMKTSASANASLKASLETRKVSKAHKE